MELQTKKRKVSQNQLVFSGNSDQSIELDYILPDYYPDIFKIIKCIMCPSITSVSTSGGRISFDSYVNIKVLYISSADSEVNCIEQGYNYTKNVEVDYNGEVCASICPRIDYNNCRAVNERRISIRGTVNNLITANAVNEIDILSEAKGGGVEVKEENISFLDELINVNKRFNYSEAINLPDTKEQIGCIYNVSTVISSLDYKIIANKIIIKAKCNLDILYCSEGEFKTKTEQLQLSNIIDANGISDEHECKLLLFVNSCEYELEGDENAVLNIMLNVEAVCKAYIAGNIDVVTDAYSTDYELDTSKETIEIKSFEEKIDDTFEVNTSIKIDDIVSVDAIIVKLEDKACALKDARIGGSVNVLALGKNSNGETVYGEKTSVIEYDTKLNASNLSGILDMCIRSYSFTLSADCVVDIRTDVLISGYAFSSRNMNVISSIDLSEEKQRKRTGGIVIYYAEPGESVWEIAKRYNSSADAIMKENSIEIESIDKRCGLLIPMVF